MAANDTESIKIKLAELEGEIKVVKGEIKLVEANFPNHVRNSIVGTIILASGLIGGLLGLGGVNLIKTKITELVQSNIEKTYQTKAQAEVNDLHSLFLAYKDSLDGQLGLRVATGSTSMDSTGWQENPYGGLTVRVDTTRRGFHSKPYYFVMLNGDAEHFRVTGTQAIYDASPKGFVVHISSTDGQRLSAEAARHNHWRIEWLAVLPETDPGR